MKKLVYNSSQTNYIVCPAKGVICVSEKSGVWAGLFNEIKRTTNGDADVGTGSSSTQSKRQLHRQWFQTVPPTDIAVNKTAKASLPFRRQMPVTVLVLVLVDGLIRSKVCEMLLNKTHV